MSSSLLAYILPLLPSSSLYNTTSFERSRALTVRSSVPLPLVGWIGLGLVSSRDRHTKVHTVWRSEAKRGEGGKAGRRQIHRVPCCMCMLHVACCMLHMHMRLSSCKNNLLCKVSCMCMTWLLLFQLSLMGGCSFVVLLLLLLFLLWLMWLMWLVWL